MNWLASSTNFLKYLKPGLIALIPVFFGCDTAEDVGTQFNLETNVGVEFVEFDLPSTNLYIDSLRTDGEDRILVGSYNDAVSGRITSEGYFQFKFLRGFQPGDTLTYDSIILTLAASQVLPKVDTREFSVDVFELTDTLINNVIYLGSNEETKTRQVGSFSKPVTASEDSVISFRLNDDYGLEIFNFMSEFPDSTRNRFFNGLALSSGASAESLATFNMQADTSRIRVYMTGDTTYFAEFDFLSVGYSSVDRDRSTSEFNGITEGTNFDISDGRTVLDPIAGLTTAFSIEPISDFFENNPNVVINTALLDLSHEGFEERDTLTGFRMYFRKDDGGIFGPAISTPQTTFSNIVLTDGSYLNVNNFSAASIVYNRETDQFISNPTLFIQSLYNNYQNSGEIFYREPFNADTVRISDLVLVHPTELTLSRAIFANDGIKLRIFYTNAN